MTIISSVRNLFIPRKDQRQVTQPDYSVDMRAIEKWANSIPITELVAGTNITLTPSSGQGSTVEISAAGGGAGGYASLTGAGQTTSPGDLTQAGSFLVQGGITSNYATGRAGGLTLNSSNPAYGFSAFAQAPGAGAQVVFEFDSLTTWKWSSLLQVNCAGVTINDSALHRIEASSIEFYAQGTAGSPIMSLFAAGTSTVTGQINLGRGSGQGLTVVYTGNTQICDLGNRLGFFGTTPIAQQGGGTITTVAQLVSALQAYGLLS